MRRGAGRRAAGWTGGRWFRRTLVMAAAGAGIFLTAGHATGAGAVQEDAFAQGNEFYQEGRFDEAVHAYRSVLGAGLESADVYYNLGNAFFKADSLGRAILNWERALVLDPGHDDARSNLDLARTLTQDAVEPLPVFWPVRAWRWWIRWLPRPVLLGLVGMAWVMLWAGVTIRVLARRGAARRAAWVVAVVGAGLVVVLLPPLAAREFGVGAVERGVILAGTVPVRSAPTSDENLVLFEIHEGTRVRIDQRTDAWAEVVLDDGKVGWVETGVFEAI